MTAPVLKPVHLGFNPTRQDVRIAERILRGFRLRDLPCHLPFGPPRRLPPEITLPILAHAEYYPCAMSSRAEECSYHTYDFRERRRHRPISVAALYLTTEPLPPYFRRASRITMQMRSADQGWATFGGDGTYENSHTWFEASILRPFPSATGPASLVAGGNQEPLEMQLEMQVPQTFRFPSDANQVLEQRGWHIVNHEGRDTWLVHHNITARKDWKDYRVDWRADTPTHIEEPGAVGDGEGFLSALQPGDKIALWARAEQIAWRISVAEAIIEIAYEVRVEDD